MVSSDGETRKRTGVLSSNTFQAAKETLGWGVIVAVARAAHAHLKLVAL